MSAQSVPAPPLLTVRDQTGCLPDQSPGTLPGNPTVGDSHHWRPLDPCGNSGTPRPGTVPVVPLFQKSPELEVIIRENAEQSMEFTMSYRQE